MPSSTPVSNALQLLRRRVDALQKRVDRLEQASEPKEAAATSDEQPGSHFGHAEFVAWMRVSEEHWAREYLDFYRRCPHELEDDLEAERERHAFYAERGVHLGEGQIARLARQLAEEQENKKRRHKLRAG